MRELTEGSRRGKSCVYLEYARRRLSASSGCHTGRGAAFIRSMLKRLLTLRSGTAAISLR